MRPLQEHKRQHKVCVACMLGKTHRQPFARVSSASPPTKPGEMLVADVLVKFEVCTSRSSSMSTLGWYQSRLSRTRSETIQHIIEFAKWVETQTGNKLKHFHSDGGGEYHPKELIDYFTQQGTTISVTSRDTPQHNGIAERMNLTLLEMTRAMLQHASLPMTYWEHAIHTAAYIINRCVPNIYRAKHRRQTRIQAFTGHKPSIQHMRVFGCNAYMHIKHTQHTGKLDNTSIPCIFIGYSQPDLHVPPYYIVLDPLTNKRYRTRDVNFDEHTFTIGRSIRMRQHNEQLIQMTGQQQQQHTTTIRSTRHIRD